MVGHLAAKTTNLPILSSVLLKTENKSLTVASTNLEVGIRHIIRCKVEEDGECVVPARLLLELLPLIPSGPLTITFREGGLTITSERGSTTLRSVPSAEFPIIPEVEHMVGFMVETQAIAHAFTTTLFAAGNVEHRPQFNGVLIHAEGKQATFVATDGYRLAEAVVTLTKSVERWRAILPITAVHEVIRMFDLPEQDSAVTLGGTESQVSVRTEGTDVVSRLVSGEYPDYLPLFPERATTTCVVSRAELTRALKAAGLFARTSLAEVKLTVDSSAGSVTVAAENAELGAHQASVVSKCQGSPVSVSVNARYLLDGLNALTTPNAVLAFTTPDRPLLLTPEGDTPVRFRYLVMPIRR